MKNPCTWGAGIRCVLVLLTVALLHTGGDARAEQYNGIRLVDGGPFQVWHGTDAENSDPHARVLSIIGSEKSLRVRYSDLLPIPSVQFGLGWAEINAASGTAMNFETEENDCYEDMILYCTNQPIQGVPPGAILCFCTGSDEDNVCCLSDTGVVESGAQTLQKRIL